MNRQDIVLLSTADWDNPFWTNKQHVAVELARLGHRILYIDSLGLRRPSATARDFHRISRRLIKALKPPRQVRDNLWIWSPIILPFHNNSFIRQLNRMLLAAGLWVWLKKLRMRQQWFWTYNPLTTEFFQLDRYPCRIYHCVDEIKAQPGMPTQLLEQAEEKLCHKVSLIFTTSNHLTETRIRWNKNTYYFSNVADFRHFSTALNEETIIPAELMEITGPKLGFIGAISSYKVDFTLLRHIAEAHQDWSIILIGDIGEGDPWTDSSTITGLPNIHILGPRSYSALPGYLKGIDVALLPNQINEYTDGMFPMKFFEYLAAGKPIVSVNLKSLHEYANYIKITNSADDFVIAIEQTLSGNVTTLPERTALAKKYTYEARTQKMLTLIETACKK